MVFGRFRRLLRCSHKNINRKICAASASVKSDIEMDVNIQFLLNIFF